LHADIVYRAFNNKNIKYGYFAPTLKMARSLMWDLLLRTIDKNLIVRSNKSDMFIELWNGSIISLWGGENYNAARGQGFNAIAIDEAAYCPPELWAEVLLPTLATTKGCAKFISTPAGKTNWYYELTNNLDFTHHHYTSIDGGWIPREEIERARALLDEKTFKQEYEASFEVMGNTVYYIFNDYVNTDYSYNPTLRTVLAWDFNINPLSTIVIQEVTKDNWVAVKEFVINNQNTESQCQVIDNWLQATGFNGDLEFTGDATGTAQKTSASRTDWQIIENYFKNYKGFNVNKKRCRSHKDRVITLNNLFHNIIQGERLKINFKECPKLVRDLRVVEWKPNGIQIDKKDGVSDPSDALSYFSFNYYPIQGEPVKVNVL
jgi:hypothetical protein